jgi:hypothetical protein
MIQKEDQAQYAIVNLPTPDDQYLAELEAQYLQFFFSKICSQSPFVTDFKMSFWSMDLFIPIHRTTFPILSQSLRYGVLAFAAFKRAGYRSPDTMEYMGRCYKHTSNAITKSEFVDIVYTTYCMVVLTLRLGESWKTISDHIVGFYLALNNVVTLGCGLSVEEWMLMEKLWHDLLWSISYSQRRPGFWDCELLRSQVGRVISVLEKSQFLLHTSVHFPPRPNLTDLSMRNKINTLAIFMQYYFLQYLISTPTHSSTAIVPQSQKGTNDLASLKQICQQIISIVPEEYVEIFVSAMQSQSETTLIYPAWRSYSLSLYFSAQLIDCAPPYTPGSANHSAIFWAIALSRIAGLLSTNLCSEFLHQMRTLALAETVVTEPIHAAGIVS